MRQPTNHILSRLVRAHGCTPSAASYLGKSDSWLNRRLTGASDADPSVFFCLEDFTGQYPLSHERFRDILRDARDAGVDAAITKRAAADMKTIFEALGKRKR